MFLLVPAHPGFPGQIPQSRKTVVCCVCVCKSYPELLNLCFIDKFAICLYFWHKSLLLFLMHYPVYLSETHYLILCLFNGLISITTWVSWHQKGKPFWTLMKQEMMGWQWHQLSHMQTIRISFQTDNYASICCEYLNEKFVNNLCCS